jgi:hypothetical protein
MVLAFGAGEFQPQQGESCLRGRNHLATGVTGLPNQAGKVAIHQQGQKQEQAAELSSEAARGKRKLAAIGDGSGRGQERCRPFFILAPRQAGKACFLDSQMPFPVDIRRLYDICRYIHQISNRFGSGPCRGWGFGEMERYLTLCRENSG